MLTLKELGTIQVGDLIQNCHDGEELFFIIEVGDEFLKGWECSVVPIRKAQMNPVIDKVWIFRSDFCLARFKS